MRRDGEMVLEASTVAGTGEARVGKEGAGGS